MVKLLSKTLILFLAFHLSAQLSGQKIGYQISLNSLQFTRTDELVLFSSDTGLLRSPVFDRNLKELGGTFGLSIKLKRGVIIPKIGYHQSFYTNRETDAYAQSYWFTNAINKNYSIVWGATYLLDLYKKNKVFISYGISLDARHQINNYISIRSTYFDSFDSLLATRTIFETYPNAHQFQFSPLLSLNYKVCKGLSLGVNLGIGIELLYLNGKYYYSSIAIDTAGNVERNRFYDVDFRFNRVTLSKPFTINLNWNLSSN